MLNLLTVFIFIKWDKVNIYCNDTGTGLIYKQIHRGPSLLFFIAAALYILCSLLAAISICLCSTINYNFISIYFEKAIGGYFF